MKERNSFRDVLNNCDDQVIVRQLLDGILSPEQKQLVVDGFNSKARQVTAYRNNNK